MEENFFFVIFLWTIKLDHKWDLAELIYERV